MSTYTTSYPQPPKDAVGVWAYAEQHGIDPGRACRRLEAEGYVYWGGDETTGEEWYVQAND